MKLLYKNGYVCFSVLIQELKLVITQKLYFTFDYNKNQPLSKKLSQQNYTKQILSRYLILTKM